MILSAIVAVADNGVIGNAGTLPWRLPADLQHFRRVTMGHHLIMGRRNYEDIARPLPGRTSVVLSRNADFQAPGCLLATSLEQALSLARTAQETECFVIGGAEVYRLALPLCSRLYLTRVHAAVAGDVHMPEIGEGWRTLSRESHPADDKHAYAYSFEVLDRSQPDFLNFPV